MKESEVRNSIPKFQPEGEFAKVLKSRVNSYFKERNISKHCNAEMIFKTIFYLSFMFLFYFMILFGSFEGTTLLGLAFLLGIASAMCGLNIGHDAIHGGYSSKKWANNLLGMTFNAMGAYAPNWKFTHNQCHHTFTSVPDADGDYAPLSLVRYHEGTPWIPLHRYQHIYIWLLYSLFTIEWVLVKDFNQIRKKNHLVYDKPKLKKWAMTKFVIAKLIYFTNVFL
jgi:linoleoyl-CoA desaturase